MSLFEKEYGALGAALGETPNGTREMLKQYRRAAKRLSDKAIAENSPSANWEVASYLLPGLAMTHKSAMHVAKCFEALRAIDRETAEVRGSEMAMITSNASILKAAKTRAKLPPEFTLDDKHIERLRALV